MSDLTHPLDLPDALLDRYVAGECTAAEAAQVAEWVAADAARHVRLDAVRAAWRAPGSRYDDWDLDAHWNQVRDAMGAAAGVAMRTDAAGANVAPVGGRRSALSSQRVTPLGLNAPRRPAARWIAAGALAAGAIVAGIATTSWKGRPTSRAEARELAVAKTHVVTTRAGERATLRLADGSMITVAPNSQVSTSVDFPAGSRDVYLDGEAVFEVSHAAGRPFVVHAANTTTTVLGTRFGVRRYANDRDVRVAVTEGRVSLGRTVLAAGDIGRVNADGAATVTQNADVAALLEWTNGVLVFERAPLGEVAAQLTRWYGVPVTVSDSATARLPLTATFRATYSVELVLRILSTTTGVRAERTKTAVTLTTDTARPMPGAAH